MFKQTSAAHLHGIQVVVPAHVKLVIKQYQDVAVVHIIDKVVALTLVVEVALV